MKSNDVIYLDNAFIVEAYEKIYSKKAHTKYTKTTDVSFGFDFIAKTGASLKETFEYPINSNTMYRKISKRLNEIEQIELNDSNITELPDLFWMEGLFGIASSSSDKDNLTRYVYSAANFNVGGKNLFLATNDIYFSSGYDQLLNLAPSFANQYVMKARMLIKFLGNSGSVRNFVSIR